MDECNNPYSAPQDSDSPQPPPPEHATPSANLSRGCGIITGGLVLVPLLYIGSFVCLLVDNWYGWRIVYGLDNETTQAVRIFYLPLIWLHAVIFGE